MKSQHSTTKRQRREALEIACAVQYRTNEGLGTRKRKLRRLRAENPKGYKALKLPAETSERGC